MIIRKITRLILTQLIVKFSAFLNYLYIYYYLVYFLTSKISKYYIDINENIMKNMYFVHEIHYYLKYSLILTTQQAFPKSAIFTDISHTSWTGSGLWSIGLSFSREVKKKKKNFIKKIRQSKKSLFLLGLANF